MNMLISTVSSIRITRAIIRLFCDWLFMIALSSFLLSICASGQDQVKVLNGSALPCSRVGKSNDFLFITYEQRSAQRKDGDKITLRLHNNSTCSVIITSGSAENFLKPLPPSPSLMDVVNRDVEYKLPDNVYVPELQYRYNASGKEREAVDSGMFFGFQLLPKHSILFDVAIRHFGRVGMGNSIAVEFQYHWEILDQTGNIYPSVEHRIIFWTDSLPDEVKSRLPRR